MNVTGVNNNDASIHQASVINIHLLLFLLVKVKYAPHKTGCGRVIFMCDYKEARSPLMKK